ncbi:PAS domain-containing sensor histidine kinase [Halonotius terrestris]|uniref:histidine kinase n=1 Tax=Halonotius terrestris TaxID=2487750 RepID=A0A8J8TDP3_9EURY|nr:PAS domain-containing sensor histidine kinase [Halonotius terrestris]TQQ83502.1 PAS domain-containing sensor histidine kinase [Halonotius terrestris]
MSNPSDDTAAPSEFPVDGSAGVLAALDGAETAIFVLDPTFAVRWINEATATYFGLDRDAVIGADKAALIESQIASIFERPDRFAETVGDTYADNTYIEEFECHVLPGEDREERWLLHQSRPIENGPLAGGRVEHYTDITDRKAREAELKRERDRLEEFAGVVSHDLRNPLNVAQGRLELLSDEFESQHLEPLGGALARMGRIIDDVLWLARAGRDIGDTEAVDLGGAVTAAWRLVGDETTDAELIVAPELDGHRIEADSDRLAQLLENLLSNAIAHGGDDVTVRVEPTATGFAIADDGPGIPPADRERVFESGYSSVPDGTGFGLRIASQVVEAHGWEISIAESPDGGARFEISGIEACGSGSGTNAGEKTDETPRTGD